MSDHLSQNQIDGYGRRALSPAELLAVSDHLAVCDLCRRQSERALSGDAAFLSLKTALWPDAAEPATHLVEERIADFLDGRLAIEEAQFVKDHISLCESCLWMVEDLQRFREEISPGIDRTIEPARNVGQRPPSGFREWLASLWPQSMPLSFASGFAVLLLVLAGWLLLQRMRSGEQGPQITQASPTPVVTPTAALPVAEEFLALLRDGGGEYRLDHGGHLSGAESLSPKEQQMILDALSGKRLENSSLLAAPDSALRAGTGEADALAGFALLRPIGKVLLSDRPSFQWTQLADASDYIVEIFDEQFQLVLASPALAQTSWTVPHSLKRGVKYSWQIKFQKDGQEYMFPRPPAPQAQFQILDRARTDAILRAQRSHPASHLPLGLLYADAGLLDEAEREFRALLKANPDSAIARRLLNQVQAMRR